MLSLILLSLLAYNTQGFYLENTLRTLSKKLNLASNDPETLTQPEETLRATLTLSSLTAAPSELIFSAVNGNTSDPRSVRISNTGAAPVNITSLNFGGPHFSVTSTHTFPISVDAGAFVDVQITFTPQVTVVGPLEDQLTVVDNDAVNPDLQIDLYGLSLKGYTGGNEPPLQDVVRTLGYGIFVGWSNLAVGTSKTLQGEEVFVQTFEKAGSGSVEITPVARFSPSEDLPFGYYIPNGSLAPPRTNLDAIKTGFFNAQRLLPSTTSGAASTQFNPGSQKFGFFVESPDQFMRVTYTEDALNAPSGVERRVRTYALRDREGELVANSFLICFEDADNGDYQDYMFVIRNVRPSSLRIDAGRTSGVYTDTQGLNWEADPTFITPLGTNGTANTLTAQMPTIANTTEDALIRRHRWADSMRVAIPVSNGGYEVELYFVEPFHGVNPSSPGGPGKRVFDVNVENGQGTLTNFDITAEAGAAATTLVKTFSNIQVNDGILNIYLKRTVDKAILSAIRVTPQIIPASRALAFSPTNLNFELFHGEANPAPKSARVVPNFGIPGTISLSQSLGSAWLILPTNPKALDNMVFGVNAANLQPGTYQATVTASANDYTSATLNVKLR
ncbi:MAG: hypothetical protein HC880_05605 [Bacteroidia bacterium]|nr:hypothetical protein [Bacteroidia bacterium]